ncbi:MAG TPA: GH116 family glycosyl-hydrolase [Puia sp.]
MQRRKFLKSSGLLGAGVLFSGLPLTAGPFTEKDFPGTYFPADKKLDPGWVRSLFERGQPTLYSKSKNELHYIGMPVGGICCGTLYLGGDGRLWIWDIFNRNQDGVIEKWLPIPLEGFNMKQINSNYGALYLEPLEDVRPLQQGWALVIRQGASTIIKRLQQEDWEEVTFEATYPIGTVTYTDKNLPLEVTLHGFAPFIPGDAHNSGLPATIQSISVKNLSEAPMTVEIVGWLENKLLMDTAKKDATGFKRVNKPVENDYCKGVTLEAVTQESKLHMAPDFGNMSFVAVRKKEVVTDITAIPDVAAAPVGDSKDAIPSSVKALFVTAGDFPLAVLSSTHALASHQQETADFIISWYTPNVSLPDNGPENPKHILGSEFHYYTAHFSHSEAVAGYIAQNYTSLKQQTFLWKQTWYDSTLPWWFLERTFMNVSTLATTTSHRFSTGRFYAWEGVGCCQGNCTHVYQYAHAMSRIFPELERDMRERVDLGFAFDEATGVIGYRGEGFGPSIDGQAGTVLRIYREHQMSGDGILEPHWDRIKKAVKFIIKQDKNGDGMEDTPLENTLDAQWSGEISWIVGLCIAAVLAGQKMAEEMNDPAFAALCRGYVEKGSRNMEHYLFNGEYFIHRPDKDAGNKSIGSYNTCHIDQVYGQSWAFQVGMGRILDEAKTKSALQSLWKYNYMPDVGPYIKKHPGGRFYALAGEGGLVMNTNPKNDEHPYGLDAKAWQLGYFSECMSGFEHQVAAHMMAEGMVEESLVVTRSIHDRYHASKRNPFNEIECSDHYGRAMASYGTFISACGFTYHGPKGHIGFAPKLGAADFKAPFTAAEGWGSYAQQKGAHGFSAQLKVVHGHLKLKKITVEAEGHFKAGSVSVLLDKKKVTSSLVQRGTHCEIVLGKEVIIAENKTLSINLKA